MWLEKGPTLCIPAFLAGRCLAADLQDGQIWTIFRSQPFDTSQSQSCDCGARSPVR